MPIYLHYYLDRRGIPKGQPCAVKLVVCKHGRNAMMPSGFRVLPSEWDARAQRVTGIRGKIVTGHLMRLKTQAEDFLAPLMCSGALADLDAAGIRDLIDEHFHGSSRPSVTVSDIWTRYASEKKGNSATVYRCSLARIESLRPGFSDMAAVKVSDKWVTALLADMGSYAVNTRNMTVRTAAAAWASALKAGLVKENPWKSRTVAYAPTRRDLSAEQFRAFWRTEPATDADAFALDFFRLSFLLLGMNAEDMVRCRMSQIMNGRLTYVRAKTGKAYSVKIEPEAESVIARLSDGVRLVGAASRYATVRSLVGSVNPRLAAMAKRLGLPKVSTYYARHTVASRMVEQGTPVAVVSRALGHTMPGSQVTSLYIDVQQAQVDAAFRQLLDWLLQGE